MSLEIERKFLVVTDQWRDQGAVLELRQGYLCATLERTVRVRVDGARAWLTIKGKSRGAVRLELEYPIPLGEAEQLLGLCDALVEKRRHHVPHGELTWEVDEFTGKNAGLVVAELEGPDEVTLARAVANAPPWVGREVTSDPRFTNAALSERPFAEWSTEERAALQR
ncbi:MAG: CYTH domain-containing protein [Polyangiaceae bacterium]|nr:CYTH domain-containing protein [Polyangiaceae bacterium]